MDTTKKYPEYISIINHLLKPKEVAEILNINRSFAYKLLRSGQIPTVKLGKSVRVRPQDLVDYIEKNTQ
jgi:excisionase family DNA binding protein